MSSPDELVICVRTDGGIESLYDERLGFDALGRRIIRRASNVEALPEDGDWIARCADTGVLIHRSRSRRRCIEEEVRYFNRSLEEGYQPFEP